MKSIKTNVLFILFLFSGLFLIGLDKVEATPLTQDDYTLQCIYRDSGLYKYSKSYGKSDFITTRNVYNLSGSMNASAAPTSANDFLSSPSISNGTVSNCAKYVASTTYKEGDTETSFYKFGDFQNVQANKVFQQGDFGVQSHWYSPWVTKEEAAASNAINTAEIFKLASEAYILNDDAPEPNASIFYVQEATQAAGTNKYAEIMVYDNVVLLRTEKMVTVLENGLSTFGGIVRKKNSFTDANGNVQVKAGELIGTPPKSIYINSPEPTPKVDSGGNIAYEIVGNNNSDPVLAEYVRYTYSSSRTGRNVNHFTYVDEIIDLGQDDSNDLCTEIMPQTAIVLREIIKYAQILVPVFLIVLTGIDFGKIVFAGNIDEEIPKQRKKIVVRLVVAVMFFFLPLIVSITTDMMMESKDGSDDRIISTINCLFDS